MRYGWTSIDVWLVPLLAGLVLLGGWIIRGMIIDPAIPAWAILIPFEPQVTFFAGIAGLVLRLPNIIGGRIALKVDSEGVQAEHPWPSRHTRRFVPWSELARIELIRLKPDRGNAITPRQRHLILWEFGDDRHDYPTKYHVPGLRLDRSRLRAAVWRNAPHVRVVDRW